MPPRRASPTQPAKTNTPARKRGSGKAPAGGAREEWQPGKNTPSQASPQAILSLQRRFGNRAVQGLIQPKLNLGPGQMAAEPAPAEGLARSSGQATRSALGLVQLKRSLVSSKTSTRKYK